MTVEAWETVLADAAGLGARIVCFIGGEPTMHPELPRLVQRALDVGLEAEVFSNLVRVTPALWRLFLTPGVRLATSWYTDDRAQDRQITGGDTYRQTLGNIRQAISRGIPLRVGMIDGILPDGAVTPCPLTRWMRAGNVLRSPLADILGTVTQMAATIPDVAPCTPDDCFPDWKPCRPDLASEASDGAAATVGADCMPDHYCNPTCMPGACRPNI